MEQVHIFQMRLGMDSEYRVGWLLADEENGLGDTQSFSYTIPWNPGTRFEDVEYLLGGERNGQYVTFPFHFNGHLFVNEETGIRFALHDPLAPQDFRGLPFLRSFSYVGGRPDVLQAYGITQFLAFLPIIPLDLIRMDQLYLQEHVLFVGVTAAFGTHVGSGIVSDVTPGAQIGRT